MPPITYRRGNDLDLDEVLDLYRSCSLRARRASAAEDQGVELIRQSREALGPRSMIVLLATPAAVD